MTGMLFALVALGLILVAIGSHAYGADQIADWAGMGAYCALLVGVLTSSAEAAFRKLRRR